MAELIEGFIFLHGWFSN